MAEEKKTFKTELPASNKEVNGMKAVSPYFDKATANEFNKGAVACFYKKYENCTMGKYVRKYRERMSSPSAISVQEPNVGEIFKGR